MYDLIGDVHGHADALERLLSKLGYSVRVDGVRAHPERRAIFLGDFVDRGPEQARTVEIARSMVDAGTALAVMGNHEFNAVAWASPHPEQPGEWLRAHSTKNRRQHQTYLDQVGEGSALHQSHVAWFRQLPLYLDLEGLRVVHACWHPEALTTLQPWLDARQSIRPDAWPALALKAAPGYDALETVLKGLEIPLPEGYGFLDKDSNPRHHIRTRWWEGEGRTYRDLALVPSSVLPAIPDVPVPPDVLPGYAGDKPVFVGHYWLSGEPAPLTPQIACLDYSIASASLAGGPPGKLCAYRWHGEATLTAEHMTWVNGAATG